MNIKNTCQTYLDTLLSNLVFMDKNCIRGTKTDDFPLRSGLDGGWTGRCISVSVNSFTYKIRCQYSHCEPGAQAEWAFLPAVAKC